MKKLIKIINKICDRAYPESKFKIKYIISLDTSGMFIHGIIIISFVLNDMKYSYKLIKVSMGVENKPKKILKKELKVYLKEELISLLIFGEGSSSVSDLLSGTIKPLDSLIIDNL